MSSFSNSSTFYKFSSSSESENDVKSHHEFATAKLNSNKSLQTSLASNLSRQNSNNSKRYIKKLKKKNRNSNKSNIGLQNNYSTSSYSLKSLKNNNLVSTISKNENSNIFQDKTISFSNSIDLNQIEFANAFESSSDSDFSNIKYLKLISKNKNIDTRINTSSSSNKDSSQSNSSSVINKEQFTINSKKNSNMEEVKHLESLTSSSSYDFSQRNINTIHFSKNDGYNDELNIDELLSDCSLSDILFVRDDGGAKNSLSCPIPETDNLFSRLKSKSPEPLSSNISLGIDNTSLPEKLSNVTINMPVLITDDNENETNQFAEDIEMNDQNHVLINKYLKTNETESKILFSPDVISAESEHCLTQSLNDIETNDQHISNNEYSKVNETNSSLDRVILNKSDSISKILKPTEESSSSEFRPCSRCYRSKKIKNGIQNTSYNNSEIDEINKKQSKSKRSSEKIGQKISDFFQNKTSSNMDKTRNRRITSTTSVTEDIGLEYDTDKDNYMVELPNGAIVPAFLSTLKSKKAKKLCACGITSSQIPPSWSQSFHDILHLHLYKLRFKGNITDYETINIKENGLFYGIVILCADHYSNENIKTTIKNVDDFVSLEYGIPTTSIKSYKHLTYLAVLPNLKIIGFLQAEPIHEAYTFTFDEQSSGHTVPVKFGISKIWVLVKYRNKNIDINLMETFCEKEKLQKGDLAFLVDGCQGIQFIQEYTGNKNILIFNVNST